MATAADVVRDFWAHWDADDYAGMSPLLAPDAEFLSEVGRYHAYGPRAILAEVDEMRDQFSSYSVRMERLLPVSASVVVLELFATATSRRGGPPMHDRYAQLYEVQDGLIVRVVAFGELDDALAAARTGSALDAPG